MKTYSGKVGHQLVLKRFGESPADAIEHHLVIEQQLAPNPAELKSTDVIIAVKSAAVGWVDLLMTSGLYQHMVQPPYCPGLEYSGEVVWTGDDVAADEVAVGEAVLADGFLTGPRSLGAYKAYGGFATYAVAPKEAVHRLPASFSFEQGCNFLGNYETAYHCLIARGNLHEGETVLIHGASGSTGLAAVQLAKVLGATVIATGRNSQKLELVEQHGADHVICLEQQENGSFGLREKVKALTSGRGVDVVYDGVGGDISLESMRCVSFGARFLIVGWAATPFVAKGKRKGEPLRPNQLPTNLIMMKGLDVLGCPTAISTHQDPTIRKERLQRLMGWVEQGKLSPYAPKTFPLTDFKEALLAKWNAKYLGGCVLHP